MWSAHERSRSSVGQRSGLCNVIGPVPAAVPRTFHHEDFDAASLASTKGDATVSVCLPARDDEATIGGIAAHIRLELMERVPLVDELVVIDDHSEDRTARRAADAGARVIDAGAVAAGHGSGHGKGEAVWKSMFATTGDVLAWCDADIGDFDSRFVVGLVGPLIATPDVGFVKGYYERPLGPAARGGGRVTELVARPLIALLFPQLESIIQPLGGEYAGRREILEQLPFVTGYGVDLGLLLDAVEHLGVGAIAQVDLGSRRHRNRTLDELGPQALAVLQTGLRRAGVSGADRPATLARPGMAPERVDVADLPPPVEVPAYGRSA